jgi:hypothetical protein
MRMIDVFVRTAPALASAEVVAESRRWAPAADPSASRHQVVTLFGDPTVTHLAWAVAAAYRGAADAVWTITADGNAVAAELSLANSVLRDDVATLMQGNGAQLRSAVAHLVSVRGQQEHSAAIRVPLSFAADLTVDADAMLASLREAEGDADADVQEDDLAA